MLKKETDLTALLENWPEHYYEIDDVLLRRQLLEEHSDDEESRQLLAMWNQRFHIRNGKAADRFMEAWLMLKIASDVPVGFLNRKAKEKELLKYADLLHLGDASEKMRREWRDFARTLLITCADTRAYRTAIFGLIDLGDKITAMRIAEEIDRVTGIYPAQLQQEELFREFRNVLIQAYQDILNHGAELWHEYLDQAK